MRADHRILQRYSLTAQGAISMKSTIVKAYGRIDTDRGSRYLLGDHMGAISFRAGPEEGRGSGDRPQALERLGEVNLPA